jgi:hypothetical protein
MDFGEVCTFFGGTIFYEEFRGDLEDVGKKIEEHIVERTDSLLRTGWEAPSFFMPFIR